MGPWFHLFSCSFFQSEKTVLYRFCPKRNLYYIAKSSTQRAKSFDVSKWKTVLCVARLSRLAYTFAGGWSYHLAAEDQHSGDAFVNSGALEDYRNVLSGCGCFFTASQGGIAFLSIAMRKKTYLYR